MNLRTIIFTASALSSLMVVAGCSADAISAPATAGMTSVGGSAGTLAGGGMAGSTLGGAGAATGGAAAGAGGLATAGGSGSGGGMTYPPTFQTFKTEVAPMCSGGLCHDLPEHPFYFKNDENLYMNLTKMHQSADCMMPVITPGNPDMSALIKLLQEDCGETLRMPYQKCWAGDPQDSDFCVKTPVLNALKEWIRRGAPENG
jgi:hypothetical protein